MGRQRELLRLSIILCMGLLFVMAGILLIVGKPAVKRPASIAVGVLMIAWGLLYLSSGNPQAPNPHLRRSRVIGYAALTCLAMACLAVVTAML